MEEVVQLGVGHGGHFFGIKKVEGFSVAISSFEDGFPGESSLRPFENEHLEEMAVITGGDAPLGIVVVGVENGMVAKAAGFHGRNIRGICKSFQEKSGL